ncbi:3-hydroxyacyl-CoA dehydrogenase [Streptomyces sp. NBC_01643]|uniref:3-hydroxyacyl-CoA dehydrogenase n=1 Tax=Streptomyces sp. NBC_01643 TaxID=2975906 RepID=UPI002F9177B7|nr:3-hydroxyacyl-CoA dehydrogenase [Streptomyces sp. NBC_01643]
MDITGSAAVVTGGGSGLGLATVRALASKGAKVVIIDLPSSGAQKASEDLHGDVLFVPADVTEEDQVEAALDVAQNLGPLRIAVNCAGIANGFRTVGKNGPFPFEDFKRILNVNLAGTFNVIRLAAARMMAEKCDREERGVIVNTASVAAFEGQIGQAAYSASKGGVVSMTLPIARDLAGHQIRVNTIAPGLFMTPLFASLSDEAIASLGEQVPHPRRLGKPEEYAATVMHIIENPMLNGETIRLDGAIRMSPR